jgi:hypothetical protein
MHIALHDGPGINHPFFAFMAEKKTGKAHASCVCLLRPLNEGFSSQALGLRAFALWAFRDEPAWRHAAQRERPAVARQRGRQASPATLLKFSSARCAAAACLGVMEWQ